jgi:hypothetical protein
MRINLDSLERGRAAAENMKRSTHRTRFLILLDGIVWEFTPEHLDRDRAVEGLQHAV